jgi:CelD/BcsL family acetyltransferase involved in cellulose biosynthesis
MPAGGTASELIALAKEDGWLAAQGSPAANLSITIRPGVGESKDAPWQASASSGLRKDLRRAARLVESELGCELRLETIPRPTAEQLIRFYRLECLGWKGTERSAIISAPQTQQFYSEIAGIFADSGRFTLNFLYFGTHIAAGQIGVLTGDSFCGLKLTYDEDFARYSPGSLLLNELLGACWRNGTCQLQLGPDGSYKRRWTSQESPVGSCFIFRRGLYGRLLHTGKFAAAPRVKRAIAFLGRRFRSGI